MVIDRCAILRVWWAGDAHCYNAKEPHCECICGGKKTAPGYSVH